MTDTEANKIELRRIERKLCCGVETLGTARHYRDRTSSEVRSSFEMPVKVNETAVVRIYNAVLSQLPQFFFFFYYIVIYLTINAVVLERQHKH